MPKLGSLELVFIGLMLACGVGLAALVSRNPALAASDFPPIIWPLGAALVFDLVTTVLRGSVLPPLKMPVRAAGVFLAMALYALLVGKL